MILLLGAASRDHKEIAELLLPYDADVNALSVNGNTPQDYANDEISYVLRKHEAKTKVELESTGTAKRFNENSLPVSVALATRAERSRVMVRGVDVKFQRISHQPISLGSILETQQLLIRLIFRMLPTTF